MEVQFSEVWVRELQCTDIKIGFKTRYHPAFLKCNAFLPYDFLFQK